MRGRYRLLLPLADTRDNIIAVDLCREPLVDAVDPLDTGGGYFFFRLSVHRCLLVCFGTDARC